MNLKGSNQGEPQQGESPIEGQNVHVHSRFPLG